MKRLSRPVRLTQMVLSAALLLAGSQVLADVAGEDDLYSTTNDQPLIVAAPGVLSNDTVDPAGPLTVAGNETPDVGSVTINADGSFVYEAPPGFTGEARFKYTVVSGVDDDVAEVFITVTAPNAVPVADGQSVTTAEDTDVSIALTGSDGNGDLLTFTVVGAPALGTLSGVAPNLIYTPNPNANGTDSFTFTVSDGTSTSAPATVDIAVTAVNDPPVAQALSFTVNEDTTKVITIAGSDPDGDAVTFTIASPPSNGSLPDSSPPGLSYRGQPNYYGPDSFTFTVSDGQATSAPATVSITVLSINDPPTVSSFAVTTNEDTARGITLTATDVEGDPLTFGVSSSPSKGALSGTAPNLTYTPNANANGTDTFNFTVSDGTATRTRTVTVNITAVNDPPVTAPVSVTTDEDTAVVITLPGSDVDGDPLTFAIVSAPANGTLSGSGANQTYTPNPNFNGDDGFTFTVSDGTATSAATTVSITVDSVNDLPQPEDDAVTMPEDGSLVEIAVLANDYLAEEPTTITTAGTSGYSDSAPVTILDVLGNPITWPDGSNQNGRVTVEADRIVYEPKPHFHGVDTFTYTIRDSDGDEATATVTVTVTAVNSVPEAPGERTFTMQEGGSITVDAATGLLVSAYDPDNAVLDANGDPVPMQTLAIQTRSVPAVGDLDIDNQTGTFTYTPPTDFVGEVSFSYVLTDEESFSEPESLVRILVTAAAAPPAPPTPGEVAINFNLANFPLEQSTGVPSNVLVVMDDSGSMDWHMILGDSEDGIMYLSNSSVATRSRVTSEYSYLWSLANATYPSSSSYGRILPTEEALQASANHRNNRYGVWRARTHLYNSIYYNPAVRYTPWVGQDNRNDEFTNATPSAVRLDPVDPTRTMNIVANHTYTSRTVPRWVSGGGSDNLNVTTYIPHYYTTTATPPLAWNATKTKINILSGAGPLSGGNFPGGPDRTDCGGDGDPTTCTYAEEIQNFANWFQYYRNREFVTKASMGKVVSQVTDVRVGYETISEGTSEQVREMNELYTEGNKKLLLDNIYSVDSFGGTPLRQALHRAGRIFACETGNYCPRMAEPAGFCQQNFALLFTDGYWNGGTGISGNRDIDDDDGPFDGGRYEDSYSSTLADTAMYHYERDIHDDYEDLVPVSARDIAGAPPGTFDEDALFMHQHMKTYAVAFGVDGTIDPASVPSDPETPFSWPDPFSGSLEKIDDLVHAATNGRGQFLNASDSVALQAALEAAFLEFTQVASSTSSAAFNSTSLEEGTLLYRGFYDLRFNTGELTATLVNADGSLQDDPLWKASDELDDKSPGARVIVSYDPLEREGVAFRHASLTDEQQMTLSEAQVNYLRGTRTEESPDGALRARQSENGLLGDIVNSSPVFVGPPRSINRDQSPFPVNDLYSEFARDFRERAPLLYVGSNDGMLHGFDARNGNELFAYVPNKLIDGTLGYRNELSQFTSPFYQHRLFVDLTPRFNDAYVRTPASPTDKDWRTLMVGGLGAGGKGFFALDVTDPSFYANETSARQAVMWEFTDEDDTYPVDADGNPLGGSVGAIRDPLDQPVKDLGYSLSLPTIAMSNVSDGGSPAQKEWIGLFGNGPNSTSGIAKLFVLFLDRGIDGWDDGDFVKIDTGYGVPLSPSPLTGFPNGLGSPTAVDTDLDGTVDRVYAGDRLGNLFRFDLSDSDPDNWSSTRLFTASYTEGGADTIQPILAQPTVIKHPTEQGFLVIFGTGSYITRDDGRNEDIQSIYAIWDRGENSPATAASDTRERRLVEQTLTNIFDNTVSPNVTRRVFLNSETVEYRPQNCATADCSEDEDVAGVYGWYVDLDMPRATESVTGAEVADTSGREPPDAQYPGERAIRRFVVRNGNIVTTTVLPALDEFSCYGTRPGAILVLSALTGGDTGEPLIDFNNDGVIDAGDLMEYEGELYSGGLLMNQEDLDGQLVDLSTLGGSDGMDFLFVSGGRDTVAYLIEGIDDRRTGRLSWRELDLTN